MRKKETSRKKAIEIVKEQMLLSSFPRLQFTAIILLTALAGFLTSFILLQIGIYSMAFRYPVAIMFAYCVFLILLRIWLWLQTNNNDDFSIDMSDVDLSDISLPIPSSSSSSISSTVDLPDVDVSFSGGGDFGGGGAGGSWDADDASVPAPASVGFADTSAVAKTVSSSSSSGGGKSGSFFDGSDLDGGVAIILIIIAVSAALIALIYVVYIAPILLAEIFVDGVLVTGLYARVRQVDRRYWLKTAVKKTIVPLIVIVIFSSIAGFLMQDMVPEARSIGEFLRYL